ncbi:MAG: cell envelope integrity protein CreD [Cytophagales bacterium]
MKNEQSIFDKINNWIKNSVMLKLVTITILMLLLLIPLSMIFDIIQERENLNREVAEDINSKWANSQKITGPILTIPLIYQYQNEDKIESITRYWNILPEELNITGIVNPKILRRGIYEVAVYSSELNIEGYFDIPEQMEQVGLKEILYNQAFVTFGISDLRGIKNKIEFDWNGKVLSVNSGSKINSIIPSGINIQDLNISEESKGKIHYNIKLSLQGSTNISFSPLGSTSSVKLKSSWKSPSFKGTFLPDERILDENGFEAQWTVLKLNRNFPQSWLGNSFLAEINASSFGVDLLIPADDYQKSNRSAKYGIMTIALTFLIFFLVEVINKRKIHPFKYALVGLSLCLFYVLLVSLSEHLHFNTAYVLSSSSIVLMISLYSLSVFKAKKSSYLLVMALTGIYTFLFITLQIADYALLIGSIGLTLILAITMYFTRNIDWYKLNIED